ncbi:MAG: hypothetical protein IGR92_10275 [Leptolyngbyaceae cyanobacterium T60_A2020_046]|nr:hypothetical protein [Leptolyngbyaceae cyanobacterium T60_A2020_046]
MLPSLYTLHCPSCLPGPGKPSSISWRWVPAEIRAALEDHGCLLLRHWTRRPHTLHVRFQYAPFLYLGELFYLQRWSAVEWAVSPSQIIFPHPGWPCSELTRRHGAELSDLVRQTVTTLYPNTGDAIAPPAELCSLALA